MHRALLLVAGFSSACLPHEDAAEDGDTNALASPAADIRVEWVEANQGVGVALATQAGAVAPADRTAYLVGHRRTLIRAFWAVDDGFVPRPIRAVLHLTTPDGQARALEVETRVDGPSSPNSLDATFSWGVTEDFTVPGLTYDIALYEADSAFPTETLRPPNRFPAQGDPLPVGIESAPARLHAVIVPIRYDDGEGCTTLPDTSQPTMQQFHDLLFMMSPVEQVQLDLHEPIEVTQPLDSLATLNMRLIELRARENAAPDVLYYGLVDVCRSDLEGVVGQAVAIPTIPPRREQAYQRVASGLWRSTDVVGSAETFVHELGHALGRTHVACRGDEGRPDATYPVASGAIGEWGFGVLDLALRHPTAYADYMTYCHPAWVSSWGWNKVYPAIREMTSWSAAAASPPSSARVLLGTLLPNGEERWTATRGQVDPSAAMATIPFEVEHADGSLQHLTGFEFALPERDGARLLMLALPEDLSSLRGITRWDGAGRFSVPAMPLAPEAQPERAAPSTPREGQRSSAN